jgi:hypothetical protein
LETGKFEIKARINGWILIRIYLIHTSANWLSFFFTTNWKTFIRENTFIPITFDWKFVASVYHDPEIDIPEYRVLAPFLCRAQMNNLIKLRKNQVFNSNIMISSFQFSYWVPISPDFIKWRTTVDNSNKFIIESIPKYVVNCEHSLQIKYHRNFMYNYCNKLKRKIKKKANLFIDP